MGRFYLDFFGSLLTSADTLERVSCVRTVVICHSIVRVASEGVIPILYISDLSFLHARRLRPHSSECWNQNVSPRPPPSIPLPFQ